MAAKKWADIKKHAARPRAEAIVVTRADVVAELEQLERDLAAAREADERSNREPTAAAVAKKIQRLEKEAEDYQVRFIFEAMPRSAYTRLLAEHPPTAEQIKKAEEAKTQALWNDTTYAPAFLAASCIEPAELHGNVAEWAEICDDWSVGQFMKLWRACNTANAGVAELPKSVAASVVLAQHS